MLDVLLSLEDSLVTNPSQEVERWMVDYEHGDGEPQHAVLSWLSTDPTTALPEVGTELVRRSDYEKLLAYHREVRDALLERVERGQKAEAELDRLEKETSYELGQQREGGLSDEEATVVDHTLAQFAQAGRELMLLKADYEKLKERQRTLEGSIREVEEERDAIKMDPQAERALAAKDRKILEFEAVVRSVEAERDQAKTDCEVARSHEKAEYEIRVAREKERDQAKAQALAEVREALEAMIKRQEVHTHDAGWSVPVHSIEAFIDLTLEDAPNNAATLMPPATAIAHPCIKDAWTLDDPHAPAKRPLMFASKASAVAAASALNNERRNI